MVIRMKTDMNLKCHQQCSGTEDLGVCAAGVFHVFSIIKKMGTKPREFCYLRLLMNALHIWVLLSDSFCKGLAVENVDGIACSWGKHLPRILSPPNRSQCKEHIFNCACIRQPIIHSQSSLAPNWKNNL